MINVSSVVRLLYALFYSEDGGNETSVNIYRTTWRQNPKDSALRNHRHMNLKPHTVILSGEALLHTCLPTEGAARSSETSVNIC
jgi:hypothetical protein